VEKPGNLGAIIRSAYAASCDGLILTDEQTDVYHPNVIRASEGFVFRLPIAVANNRDTIDFLKKQKIKIMAAALKGAKSYTQADFTKAIALVLGTESTGLSQEWLEAAAEIIKIPMKSDIDSLNVSVSAAILMFEAQRQRGII
jgi:TrmH family RNA methyltransferase